MKLSGIISKGSCGRWKRSEGKITVPSRKGASGQQDCGCLVCSCLGQGAFEPTDLSPAAAADLKDVAARRSDFEYPVLTAQDFRWIVDFYGFIAWAPGRARTRLLRGLQVEPTPVQGRERRSWSSLMERGVGSRLGAFLSVYVAHPLGGLERAGKAEEPLEPRIGRGALEMTATQQDVFDSVFAQGLLQNITRFRRGRFAIEKPKI